MRIALFMGNVWYPWFMEGENSSVWDSKLWAALTAFSATTKGNPRLIKVTLMLYGRVMNGLGRGVLD